MALGLEWEEALHCTEMYWDERASSCEAIAEEPNSPPYLFKTTFVSSLGDLKVPLSRKLNYLKELDGKSPLKIRCLTKQSTKEFLRKLHDL